MYFRFEDNGAFVCASEQKIYEDMIFLTPPDEFEFSKVGEWRYKDGTWIHMPIPVEPEAKTYTERIAELEDRLNAYEAAYAEGVNQA